jgi:hypothetical protein
MIDRTKFKNLEPEEYFQLDVAQQLRRWGLDFAADMNRGKRSMSAGMLAKAMGMQAGETDLRVYMPGGRIVLIELKCPPNGLSAAQKERHPKLRALGFEVYVLFEVDGWTDRLAALLKL